MHCYIKIEFCNGLIIEKTCGFALSSIEETRKKMFEEYEISLKSYRKMKII